jgi:putative adhesin
VKSRSVAVVALTALTASGCGVGVHFADYRHTTTPTDAHVTGPVTEVRVNADAGHVVVRTGGGNDVTIHRVVHYQSGTPHPSQSLTGGTLTFSSGCTRCRIDYDLVVPAAVRVQARTDSGRVDVTGVASADARSDSGSVTVRHVAGDVSMRSDSGSLTLQDVGGVLQAHTDSGRIRGTELRSTSATASSDSGSIRLAFTTAPTAVKMTGDSGSLRLAVPGGPYNVNVHTDSGGRHVSVPTASTATSQLTLRTDSGSVNVDPA